MEISYIILAHKNPDQIHRLVARLTGPGTFFYVHIDKSASLLEYQKRLSTFNNVFLLSEEERIEVGWGNISIVQASLLAINKIIHHQRKGYCVLISGQDYPIKNTEYIKKFFTQNSGKNFITGFPLPYQHWSEKGLPRIQQYNFQVDLNARSVITIPSIFDKKFYHPLTFRRLRRLFFSPQKIKLIQLLKKRNFPSYVSPYGGSQWWALPVDTILFINEFLEKHPSYLDYHEYTFVPDEIFFHSIIFSKIPKEKIAPSLTYVNWSRKDVPLPVTFSSEDLEELKSRPELFARKFDINYDSAILDKIDEEIFYAKDS